jgi:hypothetical protein
LGNELSLSLPKADPNHSRLKTILGTPNFPKLHQVTPCSLAGAIVLAHVFLKKQVLLTVGKEAAESRIYGGIHYRFDCDAGETAGHQVGQLAQP